MERRDIEGAVFSRDQPELGATTHLPLNAWRRFCRRFWETESHVQCFRLPDSGSALGRMSGKPPVAGKMLKRLDWKPEV